MFLNPATFFTDKVKGGGRDSFRLSNAARAGLIILMFLLIAVFILIEKTVIPKHEESETRAAYARFLDPFDVPDPPERVLRPRANPDGSGPVYEVKKYKVKRGDSLSVIAAKMLGSSRHWKKIAKANGIDDPRTLRVGQVLNIPAHAE